MYGHHFQLLSDREDILTTPISLTDLQRTYSFHLEF